MINTSWRARCREYHDAMNKSDAPFHADVIIFAGTWSSWGVARLAKSIETVRKKNTGVRIVATGPKRQDHFGLEYARRFHALPEGEQTRQFLGTSYRSLRPVSEKLAAVPGLDAYIDLYDVLCDQKEPRFCRTFAPDGAVIMYDNNHLSREGAKWFHDEFAARGLWDVVFSRAEPDLTPSTTSATRVTR